MLEVSHLVPASPTAEPGPAVKIVLHFSFSWFSLYHLVPVGPLVTGSCFIMTPKNDCLFYLVGMSCALWTFAQHLVHLTQYPCSVACCVYSQVHLVYSPLPCPEHCRKSQVLGYTSLMDLSQMASHSEPWVARICREG